MLLNLVAPEFIIAKAWCDNKSVGLVHDELEQWAKNQGVPWTRKHTHLANMGGFSIKFNMNCLHDEATQTLDNEIAQGAPTQTLEPLQDVCEPSLPSENNVNLSSAQFSPRIATSTTEVDVEMANPPPLCDPTTSQNEPVNHATRQEDHIFDVLKEAAREDVPLSVSALQQQIKKRSEYVGNIDWKVDPYNLQLVKEALRSVKEHNFTAGERRHFTSVWPSWYRNLRALQGDLWVLDAHQLCLARRLGIIEKLPVVAEDDIDDRNKSDIFVLIVALCQIGWFVLQLIARLCGWKSTSQLEIMTLAFAFVAAFTYYLLQGTPKDIACSIVLPAQQHARTKGDLVSLALRGPYLLLPRTLTREVLLPPLANPHPGPWFQTMMKHIFACYKAPMKYMFAFDKAAIKYFFRWFGIDSKVHLLDDPKTMFSDYIGSLRISNFDFHVNENLEAQNADYSANAISIGFAALFVFSAVDFIAWNFAFPTPAEKQLWRTCSNLGLVAPVYGMLGRYLEPHHWPRWFKQPFPSQVLDDFVGDMLILFVSFTYHLLARGYILVEVFRSLAYLPPDAFETSWPANLPHIG